MSKLSGNFCQDPDCDNHNKRYCRKHIGFTIPSKKEIADESEKRKKANSEYNKKAREFKAANLLCQAKIESICTGNTQDVHHMKGKVTIELLLDQRHWLPVCRKCHEVLEKNPAWAKQMGFSKSRLAKNEAA